MPLFETILLSADFSENSREAFRVACSLAQEGKTRIKVLHVAEPQYVAEEPVYFSQPTVHFTAVERDPAELDSIDDRLRQFYVPSRPLETEYLAREGSPGKEILLAAEEFDCGLIAVGTHGRTGLARLLAGSVAEEVLRGAKCPVLALRSAEPSAPLSPEIRCILAPTDYSEPSRNAARIARSLARQLGARLVLLHVASDEIYTGSEVLLPVDLDACHESLEALRTQLDSPDLKTPVEAILCQGDARTEILATAKSLSCDLIVMGTYGRTGLPRLLMGNVAEDVLRRSNRPVLTVKPVEHISLDESQTDQAHAKSTASHDHGPRESDGGHPATTVRVTAEQLREAEASGHAHDAGPSIRDRMVSIGRGNQQAGRQGS